MFSLSLIECNSMAVYSKLEHLTPHILFQLYIATHSYILHQACFQTMKRGFFWTRNKLSVFCVQFGCRNVSVRSNENLWMRCNNAGIHQCLRACRVWFLFLDELKLIPLVLRPDPLFSQQPAGEEYRALLVFTFAAIKIK